jgi:hypothetical protein
MFTYIWDKQSKYNSRKIKQSKNTVRHGIRTKGYIV